MLRIAWKVEEMQQKKEASRGREDEGENRRGPDVEHRVKVIMECSM
jgi:hypothetical protein